MQKQMKISKEQLKKREPSEIVLTKVRDEAIRIKEIKFNQMCPFFVYYFPCTNLILKDYCPYQHCKDVRKAVLMHNRGINEGMIPDKTAMENCAI